MESYRYVWYGMYIEKQRRTNGLFPTGWMLDTYLPTYLGTYIHTSISRFLGATDERDTTPRG